jgi:hypothetical protein
MAYSFNQSLYVYPLDAASDQAMVLCEVPAQKKSTIRFAMPADLLELLKMFDGQRDVPRSLPLTTNSTPESIRWRSSKISSSGFSFPKVCSSISTPLRFYRKSVRNVPLTSSRKYV